MIEPSAFYKILKEIEGKKVWNVKGGESTGSIFSFEIGDKIDRQSAVLTYEGEYSFMIYCSWRIVKDKKIITGWRENSSNGGPMMHGLLTLAGQTINEVKLNKYFDLEIKYGIDKILSVFCDLTPNQEFEENWFFRKGNKYFSITNDLHMKEEECS
jgi:hypothetical protein